VDSQTVTAVNETVRDAQQLVRHVDATTVPAMNQVLADLRPLVAETERTAGAARGALEQAQKALLNAENVMEDRSPLQYQLRLTLQEVAAAARAFRALSSYLERHPDALLFGKDGK
jgi:paraquat-inducible protein B